MQNSSPYPLGRIACLEFFGSNGAEPTTARRLTLAELTSLIKPRQGSPTCNRVLIVEDLTKEVIEVLGSDLSIDPTFFAHHLHSSRIEDSTAYTCPIRVLPSVRNQENFIIVSYVATVIFDRADPPPDRLRCSSNVRRKLTVLGLGLSCGFSAALISRKFSVLRVPQGCGWLGIILVDPPIGNTFINDHPRRGHTTVPYFSQVRLFGGGSRDFYSSPIDAIERGLLDEGRARDSMIEDLVYYWTNSLPPTFNVANGDLLSLSYYPFKIATSDFMSYADCIRSSITKLIYRVGPNSELNLKALEATLIHLQEWRRRTNNAVDKMRWSLNDIKRWNTKPCQAWEIVENDYKFLIDTIGIDDRQLKSIISVIASLLQISESRRSVQETVSLTRLSNLTLIFLPLTFVSGLFSMTGDVAPGSSHFWVYFAVAIPVAVITFNVTMYFWWFRSLPRAAPKGGVLSRMRESIPVRSIW